MQIVTELSMGSIEPNSIINGDCLEVMKFIPDKSIDCIICDLPYSITACHWDKLIPFDLLWEQYKRIIKPNGAIVLFGSQPFTSALVMSNPKWFKYEWIWEKEKGTGFALSNKQPLRKHESILIFYQKQCYYDPIGERLAKPYSHTLPIKRSLSGVVSSININEAGDRKYAFYTHSKKHNLIKIPRDNANRGLHSTAKPVPLYEYLIKTYSQENELILDNTAGSGTLAIACLNTNRRYICIEKDEHYFEVMRDRILSHDPNAPIKTKKPKKPKPAPEAQLSLF